MRKSNRAEFIRMFILDVVCDDYESLQKIFEDAASFSKQFQVDLTPQELVEALAGLIAEGLVDCYRLSPDAPNERIRGVPENVSVADHYFYISDEGRPIHMSEYPFWPWDDEGQPIAGWTCPE